MTEQTIYAVSYARVSTDDHDQNPESQLRKIREWAKAHNVTILSEFQDESTGTNTQRKGLSDLIGYLNMNYQFPDPGKVTQVIVLDADRLSRNIKDTNKILDMLDKVGVRLVYVANSELDVTTPTGLVINTIKAYGAQSYTDGHSLKIKAGLDRARAEGKHIGRPLKRDEYIDTNILLELIKKGYSLRRLEKTYKCSRNTLVRRLKDEGKYEEFVEIQKSLKSEKQ